MKIIKSCCLVMLGLMGFKTTNALAAGVDMSLCINGVAGDPANSDSDAGCIDVLSWSWGGSNSGNLMAGGGGNTNIQDLSVTKYMDNSSSYLLSQMTIGKQIPRIQLRVRKDCGITDCVGPMLYQLDAPEALVTSVSSGGSSGESLLTENISLNFASAEWCYADLDTDGEPTETMTCNSWTFLAP